MATFDTIEHNLSKVVEHVENTYYSSNDIYDGNSLNFIVQDISYDKNNVRTDILVTSLLSNTEIINVAFLKSSMCLDEYKYDLVRFFIKSNSKYQHYYVYRFCPIKRDESYDSNSFKSINLRDNWFLEIEKD